MFQPPSDERFSISSGRTNTHFSTDGVPNRLAHDRPTRISSMLISADAPPGRVISTCFRVTVGRGITDVLISGR